MKRIALPMICLICSTLSLLLSSCSEDAGLSEQVNILQSELSEKQAELDSLYSAFSKQEKSLSRSSGGEISALKALPIPFCDAEKLVHRYKVSASNNHLKAKPSPGDPAQKMQAFHVPRAELMKFIDPNGWDLDGIRFYIAEDGPQNDPYHTFVLVGTESDGSNGFNDVWTCEMIQYIEPCPTFCDNARPQGQEFGDVLTSNCRTVKPCVDNPQ